MKQLQSRINKINKYYKAECAFEESNLLKVTCERVFIDKTPFDYYPEFQMSPWIDSWLEKFAKKLDGYWEWDNLAVITLCL